MSIADKLTAVAEKMPQVYEAGKKAEHDAFWENYFNGIYADCANLFYGKHWQYYFQQSPPPKIPLQPNTAQNMFASWNGAGRKINIKEEWRGLLDFSKCKTLASMLSSNTVISHLGVIDCSSVNDAVGLNYTFYYASELVWVDEFILPDIDLQLSNTFTACSKLKHIIFGGTIRNSFNLSPLPLDAESITSAINTLSATSSGQTLMLKKTAKEAAFTADEWAELIGTKSNWTISLV